MFRKRYLLIWLVIIVASLAGVFWYRQIHKDKKTDAWPTSTIYPDTAHAIQAFLAVKYNKPLSEVHITVTKEVPGYAAGSVLFGQGGPGEGGMWLAVLGNGWQVVWDGNGSVDCNKMRQEYGFPETILKPNFCN